MNELFYMNLAIKKAWETQGQTLPNPAVGALILDKNGKILSLCNHEEAGMPHAEILALKEAYHALKGKTDLDKLTNANEITDFLLKNATDTFRECVLYTTLEPCSREGKTPSCAKTLSALQPKKIIIGTRDRGGFGGGLEILQNSGVAIGLLEDENSKILVKPFECLQKQGSFTLFKLAMHANGSISGKISEKECQQFTHNLRAKCDMLLISGKTVRDDRPTLDCRNAKLPSTHDVPNPPNITILSRQESSIDKNIPLFSILRREVKFCDQLSDFNPRGFVLCEGGGIMFKEMLEKECIDMLLLCMGKNMGVGQFVDINANFTLLQSVPKGNDTLFWLAPNK